MGYIDLDKMETAAERGMITINITDTNERLAVEVIDREASPVSVKLFDGTVDANEEIVRLAKELIATARGQE